MSAGIAAWVAQVGFWVLLPYGWFWDEIGSRLAAVFLVLWTAGWFGFAPVPQGDSLFTSFVAILDIVLVFLIFKGAFG